MISFFKNKFAFAGAIFLLYIFFLDDVDVFMIFSKYKKLHELQTEQHEMTGKLAEIKQMQSILTNQEELERFAREEHLFRKENEDIYVITHEAKSN